ncbi:hypothetical protein PVK06_005623 [Gossypium arboreum]|uniref:UBN2 domain-containing protein n=1 Tax=Gossypium arboreum TaxID=29729 RepID=A0ABR0QVH7_GOSAR|nr:hypothetical protein PVK06_005623 [Gossypium arboreum]
MINLIPRVITNGSSIPKKRVGNVIFIKEANEWDEVDIKIVQLNAKVVHTLFCALGPNEYDKVSFCDNAKEVFGKTYADKEMIRKMLNSLPKSWEAKVTAIEESKDLDTLSLDELISSL